MFRAHLHSGARAGTVAQAVMNWLYIIGAVISAAIFVYLVIALLFPEKF
jgi:K+-transporting ATPase KdpF subunit